MNIRLGYVLIVIMYKLFFCINVAFASLLSPKCLTNVSYGLLYMVDHQITNEVWQHGQNTGAGFTCNYCRCTKRSDGATRFKQHLIARVSNVKHCGSVPPDVRDYFHRDLDRTIENRRAR
jgi:hypothetical protein